MPTVNHPPEVVRHDGKTGSSETLIGWKSGKITEWRERGYGLFMKSNTVTRFKIISGFQNRLQNHRRVPVCRNKQFKRGLLDGFSQLISVFTEASPNFNFKYLHNKAAKKF